MKTLLKKKSVRFLSLLLAAALILPLALPASAASDRGSHTWTVGSKRYTANVTFTTQTQIHIPSNMPSVYHTKGTETRMTAIKAYTATASIKWSGDTDQAFYFGLTKAVSSAGYSASYNYPVGAGESVTIPASSPTGYYVIGIVAYSRNGTWKVTSIEGELATVEGLGTFTNAVVSGDTEFRPTFVKVG